MHTTGELRTVRSTWQGSTAVVMTMGALHAGHLALVRHARTVADHVVVTIFVNPLQFGAGEDLDSYPRTLESDLRDLAGEGVDLVFAPTAAQMYPDGEPQVWVRAGTMGSVLEGAERPGHFDGMLTVVSKLLHLTSPDVAVFGQKDAQQLALVRRMVADTNLPVRIDAVPIVREGDGLALSSRNVYLDDTEREAALVLSRTVAAAESAGAQGLPAEQVRAAAQAVMAEADPSVAAAPQPGERGNIEASGDVAPGSDEVSLVTCDYLELVDEGTMEPVPAQQSSGTALLVTAAHVGQTRLLDNAIVRWPEASEAVGAHL
ncbi:MAG TPA: pantoate--beta-alanine ligase [Ruania sp.]|nr:pantoate--beta-alanine ligase [Ruania sp.]